MAITSYVIIFLFAVSLLSLVVFFMYNITNIINIIIITIIISNSIIIVYYYFQKCWLRHALYLLHKYRLTTTKEDSTYFGLLTSNTQRNYVFGRARTHDHRVDSQRLILSRHTGILILFYFLFFYNYCY